MPAYAHCLVRTILIGAPVMERSPDLGLHAQCIPRAGAYPFSPLDPRPPAHRPSCSTAPLDALYGTNSRCAMNAETDAMLTIAPREPAAEALRCRREQRVGPALQRCAVLQRAETCCTAWCSMLSL
jgi:hypothetical protein